MSQRKFLQGVDLSQKTSFERPAPPNLDSETDSIEFMLLDHLPNREKVLGIETDETPDLMIFGATKLGNSVALHVFNGGLKCLIRVKSWIRIGKGDWKIRDQGKVETRC